MRKDRSDLIICRDCGIVISREIEGEKLPVEIGDIVLLGRCPSCEE